MFILFIMLIFCLTIFIGRWLILRLYRSEETKLKNVNFDLKKPETSTITLVHGGAFLAASTIITALETAENPETSESFAKQFVNEVSSEIAGELVTSGDFWSAVGDVAGSVLEGAGEVIGNALSG